MEDPPWWQDGVIYQIYPRSFSDSNGDGVGDLNGILSRLDYLSDLGITAIWLSPFYPTPDKDFGYDVADYKDVDLRFGTLEDFDQLVTEAHRRNIRIILDLVLNHTSDHHPWFMESRSSRYNPKRDWYIWSDHPNNWQASFGGSAWEYDALTQQYYLHLFTKEQPDVNWGNQDVRKEMLDVLHFWLEHGTDGFRLDVFNAYFKNPALPNNPPKLGLRGFDRQHHIYDIDQPEMMGFLSELRVLLDSYPERYAVGETYLVTPEKAASYCGPGKLHSAFSFDFTPYDLRYPWNPAWIMDRVARREEAFNAAGVWPTTVMGNHDLPRVAYRTCRGEEDARAKFAMALLLTLRGTPFLYYGDEIGMRSISLRRSEILDPPGKKYWPIYKGRDGCRSPMQWNDSNYAGFSDVKSWLPVHPDYPTRNVAAQKANPDSILNLTRDLITLRKEIPALRQGDFTPLNSPHGTMAYLREKEGQTVLVKMNFTRRRVRTQGLEGRWTRLFATAEGVDDLLGPHEIQLFIRGE
jgi:alpha-glucosidase